MNRIGLSTVSYNVLCYRISKNSARCWNFSSNVSNIESPLRDLQFSEEKNLKVSKRKRRRLTGLHDPERVPAVFSSISKKNDSVRIFDEDAASKIAEAVKDVFDKDNVILEFVAGSGLLSKALLNSGMKNLVALEPEEQFHSTLEVLKQHHNKSFNYFLQDIHEVLAYSEEGYLNNLPGINICKEGCSVQIIGHEPSWGLLVEISRRMRNGRSFLSGKFLNLCLCLPEVAWTGEIALFHTMPIRHKVSDFTTPQMMERGKQFLDSKVQKMCLVERILFQVAFDYKILATLEKRHFYFRLKTKVQQMKLDPNVKMVLIQVKSKPSQTFDLTEMQVFLTQFHNCGSRNRLVIPSLEQWAPSCGEELVKRGMQVFTRFSDLQPEELLEIFLYFKSLPHVEASEFFVRLQN